MQIKREIEELIESYQGGKDNALSMREDTGDDAYLRGIYSGQKMIFNIVIKDLQRLRRRLDD